jgi:hypothetical protein
MKQFVASDEGIEYMFTVHDLGTNRELFLPLKFFFPYRLNEFLKAILHMAYFRMNQVQPVCFRDCCTLTSANGQYQLESERDTRETERGGLG